MKKNNLALAIAPQSSADLMSYANHIARSGLYGQTNPSAVFTILATGIELGLSPVQSLLAIHVIKGKPSLSASAMMALVRRSESCEYFEVDKSTATEAVVVSKRKGGRGKEVVFKFTIEDAKRAQLGGANWTKYPAAMLRARAISGCAKQEFPEVCFGFYTPGELGGVEVIDEAPVVHEKEVFEDAEIVKKESKPSYELNKVRKALFASINPLPEGERADAYDAVKWKAGVESLSDGAEVSQESLKKVSDLVKWFSVGDVSKRAEKLAKEWRSNFPTAEEESKPAYDKDEAKERLIASTSNLNDAQYSSFTDLVSTKLGVEMDDISKDDNEFLVALFTNNDADEAMKKLEEWAK